MTTTLVPVATLLLAAAGQLGLGIYAWAPVAWIAALGLFAFQLRDAAARALPRLEPPLEARHRLAALAGVFAVGIFFCVYRLDLIPSGLNHDVAWNGLYALRILRGEPYTPYTAEAWGRETTMFYLQALGIDLFGVEAPALVYPAVVAGILLLPVLYLWLRELFGPRLALAATFLLAVSGWHLVFSRIGWRAVLQPLASTLAYWLFVRGWRRRDTLSFCGAGVAVALALYTYNAARLLPVLFPAFGLYAVWRSADQRGLLRRYRRHAVDMTGSFAAAVFPMAYYAATHWSTWQQRASATFFLDGRTIWDNLTGVVSVYLLSANGDDFFVSTPVLEWPVAVLFVFGFVWCLVQRRDLRGAFLLLGWLVAALPGFVSTPNANRLVGTMPFAYAFAALGGAFFYRQLRRRAGSAAASALVLVLTVVSTGSTWTQYFGAGRRELHGFYPDATIVARYARTLLPAYDVWIGGANYPRDTLDYLTYGGGDPRQRRYTWLEDVTQAPFLDLEPGEHKGAAFILSAEGRSGLVFEQLRRRYPQGRVVDLQDWTRNQAVFARALLLSTADLAAPAPYAEAPPLPVVDLLGTKRGSGPGQLIEPRGIAIAPDGTVFVADTGNHRVQVFGPGGELRAILGERGATPGLFNEPSDVAVDGTGKLLVVDTWNQRVQQLERDGFPLGIYTPAEGFFGPRGIDVRAGRIAVADTGSNDVALFDADGLFIGTIGGGEGGGPGQLRSPADVAMTADDRLWVVDSGNHRLQIFALDGEPLKAIPVPGWSGDELREGYLAADGDGVLLTDPQAGILWRVTSDARFEKLAEKLRFPGGVAIGAKGIYVSERDAGRVTLIPR